MIFTREQIDMAIMFWTRVSVKPKQIAGCPGDPGVRTIEAVGKMTSDKWLPGQREGFAAALQTGLEAVERSKYLTYHVVSVDYDPDQLLREAMVAAGVSCRGYGFSLMGLLPSKTRMFLCDDGSVDVAYGYADEVKLISVVEMDDYLKSIGH
jgi:hypothetical protein